MSTAIYAIWLLTSATGAEQAGVGFASDVAMPVTTLENPQVTAGFLRESPSRLWHPIAGCRHCRTPEPILYIDTSCCSRWYTGLNAGRHRQPYDHLIQFDYPWHREPGCARCKGRHEWTDPTFRSHPMLAPMAQAEATQRGGNTAGRPSAIRKVE